MNHTPTPWTFGHSQDDGVGDITDKDGHLIADCYSNNGFDGATCIENARFIIRAVNAHDKREELLERAADTLENILLHQGKHMTDADKQGRLSFIEELRRAING